MAVEVGDGCGVRGQRKERGGKKSQPGPQGEGEKPAGTPMCAKDKRGPVGVGVGRLVWVGVGLGRLVSVGGGWYGLRWSRPVGVDGTRLVVGSVGVG